jgi:hypothetical protein
MPSVPDTLDPPSPAGTGHIRWIFGGWTWHPAYVTWLAHAADHPDAFADTLDTEAAVTAWRRHLLTGIGMLDGVTPGPSARYRH